MKDYETTAKLNNILEKGEGWELYADGTLVSSSNAQVPDDITALSNKIKQDTAKPEGNLESYDNTSRSGSNIVDIEIQQTASEEQLLTSSELPLSRIYRKIRKDGFSGLNKGEKLLVPVFIFERMVGAYLLFCQAALTAGLPISNKFSTNYDRFSNENIVTYENWLYSTAPLFFSASTIANAIFTYTLIGIIEKEAKNIKDLVANLDCCNLFLETSRYGLAFAAASYDSKNAENGLTEIGISGVPNSILSWSGHAAMTFAYKGALSFAKKSNQDKGDCNIILECFKGSNAIYGTTALIIGGFRTFQMISQMLSKNSLEPDNMSKIIESAKIAGACLSFAFLTAKSLARIREPIFDFSKFVLKKATGYCLTTQSGYSDLDRPAEIIDVTSNPDSKALKILLAFGLGLALFATTINAYGNAYLADDKSKSVLNTLGMFAVAICSWAICSVNAPEIFGFNKSPSNTVLNPKPQSRDAEKIGNIAV